MTTSGWRNRWYSRWLYSLRWRLVALFVLLALAMSATFLVGSQRGFSSGWRDAIRPLISDYVDRITSEIGTPPNIERIQSLVVRLPIAVRVQGPTVNYNSHPDSHKVLGREHRHSDLNANEPNNERLFTRTTSDGHLIRYGIGDLEWRKGPGKAVWFTLAMLLFLTTLTFLAVRRMLKPLDDISAGAKRFGSGRFEEKIPQRGHDELADLAGQINTMGNDIYAMLEAKRGLLLAMSHELRSPLTRARLNTELLPEISSIDPQRAALLRDIALMNQLITDLLESERLASRHVALNVELTDIAALTIAISDSSVLDNKCELRLSTPVPHLMLDRVRINFLLRNLLDNALRYGSGVTRVPVVTVGLVNEGETSFVCVEFRDFGSGVDEAIVKKLTEPFFRADNARQRSTGGVGLGLYLCELIAKAHGGKLSLSNAMPGFEARLLLPIEPPN